MNKEYACMCLWGWKDFASTVIGLIAGPMK